MVVPATDPAVLSDQALSLLPPELATQLLLNRYVWAGTSAVFIWDILSNLKGDYMLLFKLKHRLGWPVAGYFLSRITSAAAVLGSVVFLTYPVGDCRAFQLGIALLFPIVIPLTSLLFFFRVRAVYCCARTVTIVFGLMWLTVLGTSLIIPIATRGVNIGPTPYCSLGDLAPYAETVGLTSGLFDTAVFLAISYRLVGNTHVEYHSWRQKARAFFTGAYPSPKPENLYKAICSHIWHAQAGRAGRHHLAIDESPIAMEASPGQVTLGPLCPSKALYRECRHHRGC
ncbi:hypothetical protein MVEN_02613000 [Mycena venus]|uniref:Uncharacterized protein n=1 Tax=Mycena venus TaxID=2733690 RepID=A0A8H6TW50_9AGAR|nr:hypothetical protein MVEN_02613000 [Mycena venus]